MASTTESELLELAAKAADIKGNYYAGDEYSHPSICWTDENDCCCHWNPLIDDGDALRLAVKLSLEIYIDEGTATTCEESTVFRAKGVPVICEKHAPGDYEQQCAATRRAVVRAAAEIGKARP